MKDYYEILGINRDADETAIKAAYKKLAMQYHPDRPTGNLAKFQEIQEAYETLIDKDKKFIYDNPQHTHRHPGGFDFQFSSGFPTGFEDVLFNSVFGRSRKKYTNPTIQLSAGISLEDAFTGKEILASITLPSGREQTINVNIPKGIHDGTTLKLSGIGDDSVAGLPRGDILLTIFIHQHSEFSRSGDDLIKEMEISCIDAMLGKTITVSTIDGRQLQTEIPAGIQHDSMISLNEFGMPNFHVPEKRGRLLIKVKIKIPTITDQQREILQKLDI